MASRGMDAPVRHWVLFPEAQLALCRIIRISTEVSTEVSAEACRASPKDGAGYYKKKTENLDRGGRIRVGL